VTAVGLLDMQDLKLSLMRRMAHGELRIAQLQGYLKTSEGLQDNINANVAARLKEVERRVGIRN
jgi:pyrroloquinoline quinone (PQQ) biosynthesis protein C